MPYTESQRHFFAICTHNRGKAKKKCPSKKDAKKLLDEAVSMPKRRPVTYY